MLTNETKLDRINEKLKEYGLNFSWASYNLQTYEPLMTLIDPDSFFLQMGININCFIKNNVVRFYVSHIEGRTFTEEGCKNMVDYLKKLNSDLDYCTNLKMKVPVYNK